MNLLKWSLMFGMVMNTLGTVRADEAHFVLVPVSNLKANLQFGCGAPPPNGGPCTAPSVLALDFVVPSGGSCHTYQAIVNQYPAQGGHGPQSTLIIKDFELENCTRPELRNYPVSLSVEVKGQIQAIHLVNQVSVELMPRP